MGVFDKFSGINVASGFKLQAKTPIDPRQVVDTIDDRNALITENGAYEGMQVYVKADKKTYCLKDLAASTWEELGSGGGGGTFVQADYNQNDSTAADYIKNRPFYTPEQTKIYEKTFTTQDMGTVNVFAETTEEPIILTDTVTVVFDDVEYAETVKNLGDGILAVGNLGLVDFGDNTGEPFGFLNVNLLAEDEQDSNGITIATASARTNVTIEILSGSIKMPLKYLPIGAATEEFVNDKIDRAITTALNTEV